MAAPISTPPAPRVYFTFPGTTREALEFYAAVFGGELYLHTFGDFGRDDGPSDSIAHGELNGLVYLAGSDAGDGEAAVHIEGLLLSLLGTTEPVVLHQWFDALADGGEVLDALQQRPWGAFDGTVVDRFGLRWLIGYEPAT